MARNAENKPYRGFRFYTLYTTKSGVPCIFAENEEETEIINKFGGNGGMLTLNENNKDKVENELKSNGHKLGSSFLPE